MPPLLGKEEMDAMYYGDESVHDIISTETLENICDGIQSHTNANQREACYKIHDCIRQIPLEWRAAVKATRNMGKGLHKAFKNVVK